MRVFADIRAAQDRYSAERGVPRYVTEYATAATQHRPELVERWLLQRGEPIAPSLLPLLSTGTTMFDDELTSPLPDVVHNLAPFHAVGSNIDRHRLLDRRLDGAQVVATVYDLIPLIYPHVYLRNATFRDDYLLASSFVQNADLVVTISDSAARDTVRLLGVPPRRVVSVGTGVPETFTPADDRAETLRLIRQTLPRVRPGFMLYVGGIDFRKNMTGVLEAFSQLPPAVRAAHPLVVVCRLVGDSGRALRRSIKKFGIADDVVLTDVVDDTTLTMLYQTTDLFLFPSLYEGFGLPVIEALRSGAPVVVGDNSSLVDLVPVPEARFDSSDSSAIAATIATTLASEDARTRTLREVDTRPHLWERVVENTEDAYRRLSRSRRRASRRLAFVTPLPPASTGIAVYNQRLLVELTRLADVDVFTQPDADPLILPGLRQFPYGAYDQMKLSEGYRDSIFAIGNSFFHLNEFELVRRHGGTVMLHDVRVSGLLQNVKEFRRDLLTAQEIDDLEQMEQLEFPARLGPYPAFEFPEQTQANALMSASVTRSADRVLVHSVASAAVAATEAGAAYRDRVDVIPLAFAEAHAQRGAHPDAVTSFGYLHRTKQTPLLCEAFVLAARRLPDITFAFVGQLGDSELREDMDRMIENGGVEGRVIVTGWQSEEEYSEWLGRSMLSVQPRARFNGEASAAATETLGAGIPTIVSDLGWMAELPDDAAVKIPVTITASRLADLIVELVLDPVRLSSMSKTALGYARNHSFAAVAALLSAER